jgi:hypothetical protein
MLNVDRINMLLNFQYEICWHLLSGTSALMLLTIYFQVYS